ncbi:MAG: DUF2069 domain-containing protein [Gammaproteobacteria bacterium]|nr:DUF2069 domain-containing protein [Gammaproteobacteria bacterium]
MNQTSPGPSVSTSTRVGIITSYYGLLLYFGALSVVTVGSFGNRSLLIWLFQTIPLLPFAWGINRDHLRTYFWLSMMVLLYFIGGVLIAFDPSRHWFGLIQILLCVVLFICLNLYIRQAQKQ